MRTSLRLVALSGVVLLSACVSRAPTSSETSGGPLVINEVRHDVSSVPLAQTPAAPTLPQANDELGKIPRPYRPAAPDPVVQAALPTPNIPSTANNFEGIGAGFTGPQGTFSVTGAPPDTNGAVGPNHYVQTTNSDFAVFNKSGTVVYGPVQINTLFTGFGGGCETNNDGDPVVAYDQFADRWIISQFSVSTTPYLQCVAVSTSGDPTGTWNRYSFSFGTSDFNDYPKIGVWSDGYYFTFNIFGGGGSSFSGARVCAYDRAKMLTGAAATAQCFNTSSSDGGLLPSTIDGPTAPPTGAPNYEVDYGTNSLNIWKFHVDWNTPTNSTFTGPTSVAVAAFTPMCSGGTCIPQPSTTQQLDTLADRLMYRFAYRNFGSYESLLVNHTVDKGGGVAGIRWYELRSPSSPTVFQQGTFGPDSTHRWMGSIAQDKKGDIAVGYSASSSTVFPSIRYAGRLVTDPAGQLSQGESVLQAGQGSEGSGLSRWGDYSAMTVDPSNDCTFWYTTEYEPSGTGTFNWHTRIGSFTFPSCTSTTTNDFSISATPASQTVTVGGSTTYTVSTAVTTGSAQSVALSASGLPTGATASFNPTPINSGASSTLTVATTSSTPAGTYTVTITGTGASATHSTTVTLVVNAIVTNNFSISASPASVTVTAGNAATYTVSTAVTSGSAQTVSLSSSGVPGGSAGTFNPTSVTAGGSSTFTVTTSTSTAAGTYSLTITGTGTSATHTTSVTLVVQSQTTGGGITNGGFETGTFSGWSTAGTTSISNTAHSGSHSAQLGGTSPTNGDSSAAQTFTVPSGSNTLTFWYQVHCPDTVTYDWATATLKDNTANTTATILNKTCTNAGAWVEATASVVAGHSYTLTLISHDDNYTGDPTYTLYDDVALSTSAPPPPLSNGGFESGLSGWTTAGTTAVSTTAHSGSSSAMVGGSSPTNGDSSVTQTFEAPSGATKLTFWYQVHCPDTLTYDWATATLADNTANTSTTVLAKTCSNAGTWVEGSATIVGGHSYTLTLISHDDNYSADPTYTLYDDVAVQ